MNGYETRRGEGDSATAGSAGFDCARISIAALIGVLLVALLVLDAFADDDHSTLRLGESSKAITLTEYELLSRAGTIESAAYWVGRQPGIDHFELEREANGNLYVRYMTSDTPAGDRRSGSLTVASYPVAGALERLKSAVRAEGATLSRRDGFVMLGSNDSHDAFVVFDELPELQVEVYSPRRGEAAELVASGALTPLHWTPLD